MKINTAIIALALSIPTVFYAQEDVENFSEYPNTFSSGSTEVSKFTQESKRFNDWSISAGAGVPLVQSSDLTSIKNGNGSGKDLIGYSAYFSIDKAITHTFGLKLQYDRGETRQGWFNTKDDVPSSITSYQQVGARTQYDAISLLADLNFSNLLRRVDNKSNYRWALHGYAGIGTIGYRAYVKDLSGQRLQTETKMGYSSLFGQAGAGLKFKVNRRIDIEGRLMYVVTGDDQFDGGGEQYSAINKREDQISDNMFNAQLGVTFKLGKHQSHLFWHDPFQEVYHKLDILATENPDIEVCKNGDLDNDGVCDDWDRQLDTPEGARVDGSGVALDADLDGVIDLFDKCVTVPGPASNEGCPVEEVRVTSPSASVVEINKEFEGIEFALNKAIIRPQSFNKLDTAAEIIKTLDNNAQYYVVGATDTRGSNVYNKKLSQRRADAVVKYLVDKGVPASMLIAEGRGEEDLKYPECEPATKCPEWKNEANRRVFFEAK